MLLKSGAIIGLKDDDGKTVLHRAVEGNHVNIVNEILKIDPSLKQVPDNKGKLPNEFENISKEVLNVLNKF